MKKIINYSGIPGLILISALFFLTVSCNKDRVENNPDADNSSQLIKISGEDAGTATKTTLELLATKWVMNTDFVGIYSPQARPTSGGSAGVTNRKYIATTSASSSAFSPASGNEMYWGTGSHSFYAYYPYSGSAGIDATVVPITLSASQTQSAGNSSSHLSDLDFMVATPVTDATGTSGAATTVNLRYNHVFSILEFQIKRSSGSGKITKVKLTAPTTNLSLTSGTVNITSATPGAGVSYTISSPSGTKEITLTITDGVTPTADYATTPKIYMMILPGDFHTEDMTIGLNYENSNVSGTYVYENTTKTGKVFARGMKYVVQMDDTPASVTDVESNVYTTVRIGSQVWMASNLKTTKYNDGSAITSVTNAASYDYNNPPSNSAIYGKLYNWYAVNTGKLCPTGWHVPTDVEWITLTTYLGGTSEAGDKLKETGTTHWISNTAATNSSGFTALPGGYRYQDGSINYVGSYGYWWSSTARDGTNAWNCQLSTDVYRGYGSYVTGFSVRCVRD